MLKKGNIQYLFKIVILTFALVLVNKINAQEVRIIDNKGTINTVRNNNVTVSITAPTDPVENDIWFDTAASPNEIKIYDGTTWVDLDGHRGTTGSVFFADAIDGAPTEDNTNFFWDDTNNRLGIGTNSPDVPLHISANTGAAGILRLEGTEPDILFNDTNGGFNTFTFQNAGVDRTAIGRRTDDAFYITMNNGGWNDDALVINNADSFVGLDVNIPEERLHVGGRVRINTLDTGTATDQIVVADTDGVLKKVQLSAIVPTIYAAGKVNANGTTTAASIYNASVTKLTTNNPNGTGTGGTEGDYLITFDTALPDANYIIQLTILDCGGDCPGNTGTDYDDPGITYYSQDEFGFSVNIGDSDNGGNEKDDIDLDFMFTVIILP